MNLLSKTMRRLLATVAMLGAMTGAQAFCVVTPAHVATVASGSGGAFDYQIDASALMCIGNSSFPRLSDFYLPYFSDMGIANIQQSEDWAVSVEASNDLFGIGGGVLHFYSTTHSLGYQLSITFQAAYDTTAGVAGLTTVTNGGVSETEILRDQLSPWGTSLGPVLVVGSPDAIAALQAVPEPSTYAMLFAGLLMLAALRHNVARRAGRPRFDVVN